MRSLIMTCFSPHPISMGLGDKAWARHHLSFPPDIAPADMVVSRLANELNPDTRALTVRDMAWVKTLEQQIRSKKKVQSL